MMHDAVDENLFIGSDPGEFKGRLLERLSPESSFHLDDSKYDFELIKGAINRLSLSPGDEFEDTKMGWIKIVNVPREEMVNPENMKLSEYIKDTPLSPYFQFIHVREGLLAKSDGKTLIHSDFYKALEEAQRDYENARSKAGILRIGKGNAPYPGSTS